MPNFVGQQLGTYQLLRLLEYGYYGNVYLAEHLNPEGHFALKVLDIRVEGDAAERVFRQEASLLARLDHPHIVKLLDFGVAGVSPFIVMPLVPDRTLRQRHPKGTRLDPTTILTYLKQVAAALQYGHDQHVVHRYLTPENILIGSHDELLLSDFGTAIWGEGPNWNSELKIRLIRRSPTPDYIAPEQLELGLSLNAKSDPGAWDQSAWDQYVHQYASDQYALGTLLYEWLSGTLPFAGTKPEALFKRLQDPPPPLHPAVPNLPPGAEEAVLQALAKEPQERFASVQEFADAFEAAYRDHRKGKPGS